MELPPLLCNDAPMLQRINDACCNTWIGRSINRIVTMFELAVIRYYHDKKTTGLLKEIIYEDKPFILKPSEVFLLYSFAQNQLAIDGAYAEVGVFKGTTAKAICEGKEERDLYLFDTFEGLPEIGEVDRKFKTKMFRSNEQRVREKLAKYPNVHICKGMFPATGSSVQGKKFAFVHLDTDIYQSTKDCLEFFYGRMSKGGIIISHDYHAQGVRKAFDEFFRGKPERVIQLPMSQCMITKR